MQVVEVSLIIEIATMLGTLIGVSKAVYSVMKWFQKQNEQSKLIEDLRKKEVDDVKELKDELYVVSFAMSACLDGLKHLAATDKVTEAQEMLDNYLNNKAHNRQL